MAEEVDPYEALGLAPDAGSDEVRRAFHEAVLGCHPDCAGGGTDEAKQRFGQIVAAYRLLRARLAKEALDRGEELPPGDQFDPSDFAWLSLGWESLGARVPLPPAKLEWLPRVVREKVIEPAVNETTACVVCWIAAIVLAVGAGAVSAAVLTGARGIDDHGLAICVAAMMGTYVLVFGLSLVAILAGRRTSWLLRVIGFRRQRALPSPRKGRKLTEGSQ